MQRENDAFVQHERVNATEQNAKHKEKTRHQVKSSESETSVSVRKRKQRKRGARSGGGVHQREPLCNGERKRNIQAKQNANQWHASLTHEINEIEWYGGNRNTSMLN